MGSRGPVVVRPVSKVEYISNVYSSTIVQRLRITFSSDCAFCDKSTKIGTLVVLYISSNMKPVSRSRSSPVPGVVLDFLQNDTTSYRL